MASSPLASVKNRLIFAGFWLLWSLLHVKMLLEWGYGWTIAITDMLLSNGLLALACILVSNNMRYYRPRKGKYFYILVICLAISGLWSAMIRYGLAFIFPGEPAYLSFLENSMAIRFDIVLLVTGCVALMSELWYTLEEQQENEIRKADAEKLAKDAELYKLRQQLQPHFLFNSLNSISALVSLQPEQARKMIQQLSEFLRGTLKKEENQWATLGEELEHLQLYLEIEKVRFGYRLHTVVVSDEQCNRLQVPHMLLQPLVENAIKFGLYDTTEPVTIRIEAKCPDNYLIVSVQNPFDPETSSPKQGTGFGLHSVQRRLYLLFARNDLLNTVVENNLFTTIVKIPQV